jgi:hypothetical protein
VSWRATLNLGCRFQREMNMPNECYERVQMKDGSFALCKVSYVVVGGELRITGIVEEVGVRRDAAGVEIKAGSGTCLLVDGDVPDAGDTRRRFHYGRCPRKSVAVFLDGLPYTQGLTVGVGTKAAQMATRLAAEADPLVTVSPSPRSGRIVIKRTRKGGAK